MIKRANNCIKNRKDIFVEKKKLFIEVFLFYEYFG